MSEVHYISIEKTARYFLSGPLEAKYRSVCFALHGHGQLGQYFIRPFERSQLDEILFVAPEGPHRFYLQGTGGRVGASWMTKEDRLNDIKDYCAYLDRLYEELKPVLAKADSVGILGFSQGVATACRWLSFSSNKFDYLINYAGIYPPDLPQEKAIERMQKIPVKLLLGSEDEYITEDKFREALDGFKKQGYPADSKIFEGKHKIYPEVLQELFEELGIIQA